MLNLESRQEVLGITVFQDTDRQEQFYYLPGPPHISREGGEPLFDLFSFRKGGESSQTESGGFLNMAVDLGLGGLRDRIEGKLREQYGDSVVLGSVPITKGKARVIALGEDSAAGANPAGNGAADVAAGPRFIESILGAGTPSLDGDNRAIFSFSLTEEGAAFFLGVLNGAVAARPVGVIYELNYVGLLPAYDLEIEIDFKSSYDYMRSRFTLGTLFFRADVDNIVEELQREEHIKIRETARTLELSKPEAVRERQNRIDQLVKDLATGALFQPSLTPGQPRVSGDTITAADPTTAVGAGTTQTEQALRYGAGAALLTGMNEAFTPNTRGGQTGAGGVAPPSGGVAGGGGNPSAEGAAAGGGSGAGNPAGSGQQATGGGQPTSAADVWNRLGRPQAAFALKNISQQEQRTVRYSLSQVTAQEQTVAPQNLIQFLAGPRELDSHVHVVDLDHPFFQRININVNAGNVDFAATGVTQMTVQLRYGVRPDGRGPKDTAEAILRSHDDGKDFTFFVDHTGDQSYEYKLIADYRHDFGIGMRETRVEGEWARSEARSLAVHPGWLGAVLPVTVQLAPVMPEDVSEVQALVRYSNPARGIEDSALVQLKAQQRSELVPVRLASATDVVEITPKLFYSDGTSEELAPIHLPDPTAGADNNTVVVAAPKANRLDGDIVLQDPLGELQSVLADIQVIQDGNVLDSRTFEMTAPGKREIWSVRLPEHDKPTVLSFRQRRFYKDGGLEVEEWAEAPMVNLIAGIPAADVFSVAVKYLGPRLADLGIDLLLLDLEYKAPDGNSQFDQASTLMIGDDATSHDQEWKIRLPSRQARGYRWRLTLIPKDGQESSTEFRDDSRSPLILRAPQL